MSDTPRTDTASRESTAFDTPTNAINFARQLERENAELRKDKERLDWILSDAGGFWLSFREDIDKEMQESE